MYVRASTEYQHCFLLAPCWSLERLLVTDGQTADWYGKYIQARSSNPITFLGAELTVLVTFKLDIWQVKCNKLRHQV
jgi:hypothetical protein